MENYYSNPNSAQSSKAGSRATTSSRESTSNYQNPQFLSSSSSSTSSTSSSSSTLMRSQTYSQPSKPSTSQNQHYLSTNAFGSNTSNTRKPNIQEQVPEDEDNEEDLYSERHEIVQQYNQTQEVKEDQVVVDVGMRPFYDIPSDIDLLLKKNMRGGLAMKCDRFPPDSQVELILFHWF